MRSRFAILASTLIVAMSLLPQAASGQEIAGGGAGTFFTKGGHTEQVGDVFAELSYNVNIEGTDRFLQVLGLGGFGEDGDGLLGIGARHFWGVSPGIYPAVGAQLFYLNGGDLDNLFETTIFAGPEVSCELLADTYDVSIMPFIGWYPALAGDDDTNIFRFGLRLNELPTETP